MNRNEDHVTDHVTMYEKISHLGNNNLINYLISNTHYSAILYKKLTFTMTSI